MHVKLLRATRSKGDPITSSRDAVKLMTAEETEVDREVFWILHLNGKHRFMQKEVISIGSLTASIVHPRETFKRAILLGAAAILTAHNHPSGDPTPSSDDIAIWKRLDDAGELLGIKVLDHIILGHDGKYYSSRDAGW